MGSRAHILSPAARIGRLLVAALAACAVVPAAASAATVIPAGSLSIDPPGIGAHIGDGEQLELWSNGSAGTTVTTGAVAGITVRARGDQCEGPPVLAVEIDGARASAPVATTAYAEQAFDLAARAGTHRISVSLVNDRLTPACDRNLYVDRISLVGPGDEGAEAPLGGVTKLLTIVEENHSLAQMRSGMPYLSQLAAEFGSATRYTAIRHPSLPNYLAIAGGSTFGVTDDAAPAAHRIAGASVFGRALAAGRTAKAYIESMPSNCAPTGKAGKGYAVRHNPWPYFVDEAADCLRFDVAAGTPGGGELAQDIRGGELPDVGLLVPNACNDAHDCPLSVADDWLKGWLPAILASEDFTAGRLAVVVTADEDDGSHGNTVLTVVLHESLHGMVVTTPLDHYSLTRAYAEIVGDEPLREAAGATSLLGAFGLSAGEPVPASRAAAEAATSTPG